MKRLYLIFEKKKEKLSINCRVCEGIVLGEDETGNNVWKKVEILIVNILYKSL